MKPKLLLVSDTYHPKVDGTVIFIDQFLKRAASSFDISLLIPKFASRVPTQFPTTFMSTSKVFKPLPDYPAVRITLGNLRRLKRSVKESDIIFIQGPAIASFLAMYYGKKFKKHVVSYTHVLSWELFEKSKNRLIGMFSTFLKKTCITFYNFCNEILIPYQALKDQFKKAGIHAKMTVARLGVDIEKFSPPKDKGHYKRALGFKGTDQIVGYVGRISPEKNIQVLTEAFAKLDMENTKLLIVGNGSDEQKALVKGKNVKITGFVTDVHKYLKAMDVFVMPSLTETTSLATLEAMSCGLPVVATKVGFMKTYITKNHNGTFFPRNNSTILALKIQKLLDRPELRESLGKNARKTIAYSFSWERSINKIKRILQK